MIEAKCVNARCKGTIVAFESMMAQAAAMLKEVFEYYRLPVLVVTDILRAATFETLFARCEYCRVSSAGQKDDQESLSPQQDDGGRPDDHRSHVFMPPVRLAEVRELMVQSTNYESDFFAWAQWNASLLREGRIADIDCLNIAEELDALSRRERRELLSRLTVLLVHLLKWRYQPERQSRSWRLTINTQRRATRDVLEDSPSLKADLQPFVDKAYERAIVDTADETGIDEANLPGACPWGIEQILDRGFLPTA